MSIEANDEDLFASPAFKEGLDIGKSLGRYEAESEAARAFEAGEIEFWLAWSKPKTLDEWETWDAEHGADVGDRWKPM